MIQSLICQESAKCKYPSEKYEIIFRLKLIKQFISRLVSLSMTLIKYLDSINNYFIEAMIK